MLLLSVRGLGKVLDALADFEDGKDEIVQLFRLLVQSGKEAANYS